MEIKDLTRTKAPKYCDGCGKPLFKYWVDKVEGSCVIIKIDVSCKRDLCVEAGTTNKTVLLRFDLEYLRSLRNEKEAV